VGKINGDFSSPDFGQPYWILAGDDPAGLGSTVRMDWSSFGGPDGFSNQHNFHPTRDGKYMLLDNDHGRVVRFTLDELAGTATLDGVFSTAEGSCGAQGTAQDTVDGNVIAACNTDMVREYDGLTGAMLWEGEVRCANGGAPGFFGGVTAARWYPISGW
jgi:hypothetical protein